MIKKLIQKHIEEKKQKELLLARKEALLKEIRELERKRDAVKERYERGNKLQEIEDEREHMKLFYGNRHGIYGIWEDIPGHEKWDNTFFHHNPVEISKTGVQDLSSASQKWMRELPDFSWGNPPPEYVYTKYTLWIEAIIPNENGPILKLTDPFDSVYSNPLRNVSIKQVSRWTGRMAVVTLGLSQKDLSAYDVQSITLLPYTLTERLGKEEECVVYSAEQN